jgi:hypothetical protein
MLEQNEIRMLEPNEIKIFGQINVKCRKKTKIKD